MSAAAIQNHVRVECSGAEFGALGKIGKKIKPQRHRSADDVAAYVLKAALLHWDKLVPFIVAHENYAKAEGFFQPGIMQAFQAKTIAKKFRLRGTPDAKHQRAV